MVYYNLCHVKERTVIDTYSQSYYSSVFSPYIMIMELSLRYPKGGQLRNFMGLAIISLYNVVMFFEKVPLSIPVTNVTKLKNLS